MSLQHVFTSDIKGGCFISDSLRSSPKDNSELQDIYWGKTPMKEIRTWAEVGDERLQIIIVPIHIKGKKRWIHSTYERQVPIPAFSRTPIDPEPSTVLYIPCVCVCVCVCTHARGMLSGVQLFATPWLVAHQAPLSFGFSRQEHWSGLPFPAPGDLPDPGIKPTSLVSPALAGKFFTVAYWEAPYSS